MTNTDPVRALIAKWQAAPYGKGDHDYYVDGLRACADELEAARASAPPSATVGAAEYMVLDAIERLGPSAPVGVAAILRDMQEQGQADTVDGGVVLEWMHDLHAALAQQPAAVERTKWVCGFCTRHYYLPNPCGRYCCDAQAEFRAAQQPAAVDAYSAGWRQCAKWAGREDLIADIDSPAYEADRAAALAAQQQGGRANG